MKSEPYTQFISRNQYELSELMRTFHEVNHFYSNMFLLTLDANEWELYDCRVSRSIVRFPFKKLNDFRTYLRNLMYDMANIISLNKFYNGARKLKRLELSSCRRILNLYGFDEYFITNKSLVKYIIYAELEREKR